MRLCLRLCAAKQRPRPGKGALPSPTVYQSLCRRLERAPLSPAEALLFCLEEFPHFDDSRTLHHHCLTMTDNAPVLSPVACLRLMEKMLQMDFPGAAVSGRLHDDSFLTANGPFASVGATDSQCVSVGEDARDAASGEAGSCEALSTVAPTLALCVWTWLSLWLERCAVAEPRRSDVRRALHIAAVVLAFLGQRTTHSPLLFGADIVSRLLQLYSSSPQLPPPAPLTLESASEALVVWKAIHYCLSPALPLEMGLLVSAQLRESAAAFVGLLSSALTHSAAPPDVALERSRQCVRLLWWHCRLTPHSPELDVRVWRGAARALAQLPSAHLQELVRRRRGQCGCSGAAAVRRLLECTLYIAKSAVFTSGELSEAAALAHHVVEHLDDGWLRSCVTSESLWLIVNDVLFFHHHTLPHKGPEASAQTTVSHETALLLSLVQIGLEWIVSAATTLPAATVSAATAPFPPPPSPPPGSSELPRALSHFFITTWMEAWCTVVSQLPGSRVGELLDRIPVVPSFPPSGKPPPQRKLPVLVTALKHAWLCSAREWTGSASQMALFVVISALCERLSGSAVAANKKRGELEFDTGVWLGLLHRELQVLQRLRTEIDESQVLVKRLPSELLRGIPERTVFAGNVSLPLWLCFASRRSGFVNLPGDEGSWNLFDDAMSDVLIHIITRDIFPLVPHESLAARLFLALRTHEACACYGLHLDYVLRSVISTGGGGGGGEADRPVVLTIFGAPFADPSIESLFLRRTLRAPRCGLGGTTDDVAVFCRAAAGPQGAVADASLRWEMEYYTQWLCFFAAEAFAQALLKAKDSRGPASAGSASLPCAGDYPWLRCRDGVTGEWSLSALWLSLRTLATAFIGAYQEYCRLQLAHSPTACSSPSSSSSMSAAPRGLTDSPKALCAQLMSACRAQLPGGSPAGGRLLSEEWWACLRERGIVAASGAGPGSACLLSESQCRLALRSLLQVPLQLPLPRASPSHSPGDGDDILRVLLECLLPLGASADAALPPEDYPFLLNELTTWGCFYVLSRAAATLFAELCAFALSRAAAGLWGECDGVRYLRRLDSEGVDYGEQQERAFSWEAAEVFAALERNTPPDEVLVAWQSRPSRVESSDISALWPLDCLHRLLPHAIP